MTTYQGLLAVRIPRGKRCGWPGCRGLPRTGNRPDLHATAPGQVYTGDIQDSRGVLLADLGVAKPPSRPRGSNGKPSWEAWFKTLKYGPAFPERFTAIGEGRGVIGGSVDWYNCHRHSGTGFHTPAGCAPGPRRRQGLRAAAIFAAARARHLVHFTTTTDPKILDLRDSAWISQPRETPQKEAASLTLVSSSLKIARIRSSGTDQSLCSG